MCFIKEEMYMKAICINQHGGPEVLQLQEIDIGATGKGQVKVSLKAVGVNFVDIYFRRGFYQQPLPFICGREGAGIVREVGEGVTAIKVGDKVAFTGEPGAYAEEIIVPEDRLIKVPEKLSFEEAAAFPLQGMTAHYLLHEFYHIKPKSSVLIHAAAGGMGLLLVQWAKHLGAHVIGTISTEEKAKAAKAAGAHDVILYTKQNFVEEVKKITNGQGVDFIIDGVGKTTFTGDLEAARIRGHIVVYGAASGAADPISPNDLMGRSLTVSGANLTNYMASRQELVHRSDAVLKGIEEGWLKLKVDHVLPLAQASKAHEILENRKTMGKIVLTV